MRLAQKLILYALAVALIPLAVTGFSLIRTSQDALRERIVAHQKTSAVALAAQVSQAVEALARKLATVLELVDIDGLDAAELEGLLRMLYRQSPDIAAAVLVDSQGEMLAPAVYLETSAARALGHVAANERAVARLLQRMPLNTAAASESDTVLMSAPYFPADGPARVAVAIPCRNNAEGEATAVAAVEIALAADILRLEGIDLGRRARAFVVDGKGRAIFHPAQAVGADLRRQRAVNEFLQSGGRGVAQVSHRGDAWVAAYAPVGNLGWATVVEQPQAVAFASAAAMERHTLLWIGLTIVVVLASGIAYATRLRRALGRLVSGARDFGARRLSERIRVNREDELGELAGSMNEMAGELQRSLAALEDWNQTLEGRVEDRTRALREAQAELTMQSKLAALGQLGAGVAHELNNPLAGILGYTQLLQKRLTDQSGAQQHLDKIEDAARRCKSVTERLLRFSERGLGGRSQLVVNEVVAEVLELMAGGLSDSGIVVDQELAPDLPEVCADGGQLGLVLINLMTNARNAMQDGGRLRLQTRAAPEGVQVVIADSGHGIAPEHLERIFDPFFTTKQDWRAVGLGLSVAYRIVSNHGGRIDVDSTEGEGTTFTVTLPPDGAATGNPGASRDSVLLA